MTDSSRHGRMHDSGKGSMNKREIGESTTNKYARRNLPSDHFSNFSGQFATRRRAATGKANSPSQ
jgi:hypothetical protein